MSFTRYCAVALAAVVSAGCSAKSQDAQSTAAPAATVTAATPLATPSADPNAAASPTPQPRPSVMAFSNGNIPHLGVGIESLRRDGDTVTLRFVLTNDSTQDVNIGGRFAAFGATANVAAIYLADLSAKKKYLVLADSHGECLCSDRLPNVPSASFIEAFAKFPAPPPSVHSITVFVPDYAPFEHVAIEG